MTEYFKLNIEGEEKTVAIVSLYTEENQGHCGFLYIGSGCYKETEFKSHEWTRESFDGHIPYQDLFKWALSQGYLKYSKED